MVKIPVVYLDIAERLYKNREAYNKISIDKAKRILGSIYHFQRINITNIIGELQDFGLIEYNHRYIVINSDKLLLLQ